MNHTLQLSLLLFKSYMFKFLGLEDDWMTYHRGTL